MVIISGDVNSSCVMLNPGGSQVTDLALSEIFSIPNPKRGSYTIFDGISGSGKDTQMRMLKEYAEKHNLNCIFVQEPTDNPIGKLLKSTLKKDSSVKFDDRTKALLFTADRSCLLDTVIEPALNSGIDVLSNRGFTTTLVSQSIDGTLSCDYIKDLNSFMPKPALVLIYDVDPETAYERIRQRGEPMNLDESKLERQRIARQHFQNLPNYLNNVIILDTGEIGYGLSEAESIDALFDKTLSYVLPLLRI